MGQSKYGENIANIQIFFDCVEDMRAKAPKQRLRRNIAMTFGISYDNNNSTFEIAMIFL